MMQQIENLIFIKTFNGVKFHRVPNTFDLWQAENDGGYAFCRPHSNYMLDAGDLSEMRYYGAIWEIY